MFQCAKIKKVSIYLLLALALTACGGGDSSSLTLHFNQNPLTASIYLWDIPGSASDPQVTIPINATVQGQTSASAIYVLIADQNNTFQTGQINLSQTGSNAFEADLRAQFNLSQGLHAGTLKVQICSDLNCASVLASADLPYEVSVVPNPTLTLVPSSGLTGKALVTSGTQPDVVGFNIPSFTLQSPEQIPDSTLYPIYVKATDGDGLVHLFPDQYGNSYYSLTKAPQDGSFELDFEAKSHPAKGEYSGTLTFTLCHDVNCKKVFNGSSGVSYHLSVSPDNLTTLASNTGLPDWQTAYGNPAHSSYVPITVNTAAMAPRWISNVGTSSDFTPSDDIVSSNGRIYVTNNYLNSNRTVGGQNLYAINESDASIAWQKSFDTELSRPAAANGKIYVQTRATNTVGSTLYGLNATDGSAAFQQQSHNSGFSAPQIMGSDLLIADYAYYGDPDNGSYLHFYRYDGGSGASLQTPACLQSLEQSSGIKMHLTPPTDDKHNAYILTSSGLAVVDFSAAQSCKLLNYGNVLLFTSEAALAPSGNLLFISDYCASDQLMDVSTLQVNTHWFQNLGDCGLQNPAIAKNVVYTARQNGLTASDETTGTQLWNWNAQGFENYGTPLLATDNLVFLRGRHLYAVDTSTHKVVWSFSHPQGTMAISSTGVLYVLDSAYPSGTWSLMAINLQ